MSSCCLLNISLNFRATGRSWIKTNNFSEREYIRALKERGGRTGDCSPFRMANAMEKLAKTRVDSTGIHGGESARQSELRRASNGNISVDVEWGNTRKFRHDVRNPEKIDGAGGYFFACFNKILTSVDNISLD